MNARQWTGLAFWCAGAATAAWIAGRVNPVAYEGGRARDEEERIRRNTSSLAVMLGEFRTGLSDMMFIKTERYLHAGVAYIPHHGALSAEALAEEVDEHQSELGMPDEDGHHDHDHHHHHEHEHTGTPTLIPPAERDFRGLIGRLHRQVQPWRDPQRSHVHTDGRELIPWFRLMTASDPRYIRGYVAGGFWLQAEGIEPALAFIEEGIAKNPEAFQLYVSRGFLRVREARAIPDPDTPLHTAEIDRILALARDDFIRAADLAADRRPDDVDEAGFGSGGWGSYHESDAVTAALMSVTLTRNLGDQDGAWELAQLQARRFPDVEIVQQRAMQEDTKNEIDPDGVASEVRRRE